MSKEQKLTEVQKGIIKQVGQKLCTCFRKEMAPHLLGMNYPRAIVLKMMAAIISGFCATEIVHVENMFEDEEKSGRLHAQKWMAQTTVMLLTDVLHQQGLTPDGVKQMEKLVGEAVLHRHGLGDDETKH